ncbi:hypothetical protein [Tenacibaculum sp. SDUM215027]|uniref:hypothetical protein n=1 Tax=Tenacibaculum sp. SDUM215027 TaxID=3422596 RepID=UPI003D31E454
MSKFNIETQRIKHHFLMPFVAAVLDENSKLKHKLEIDDLYQEFLSEKVLYLLDEAIRLRDKYNVSLLEALDVVQENFKNVIANE